MPRPWVPRVYTDPGLWHKPQVRHIATRTGLDVHAVVGRLMRFWVEAQVKADETGFLKGKPATWVDLLVECPGFAAAVIETGWLASEDGGLRIGNFDEYVSKVATQRIEKTAQQAARRAATTDTPATLTTPRSSNDARMKPDSAGQTPTVPTDAGTTKKPKKQAVESPLFDRFWAAYPRKVARVDASRAFAEAGITEQLMDRVLAALARQAQTPRWRDEDGRYIPHPATWLRGRRWEDEPGPGAGGPVGGGGRVGGSPGQFEPRRLRTAVPPAPGPGGPEGAGGSLF